MKTETVDVLIAGLGPAGASAARAAAAAGSRVIAIDRKKRPGLPVQCAEFVPSLLSPTIEAVSASRRQPIRSMLTYVENDRPDLQAHFPGVMVDRAAFDAHLVEAAGAAGADCRFDVGIEDVDDAGVVHCHNGSRFAADVVIGADGPRSRIGRAIGQINRELVAARQITVPLLQAHSATDIFLSANYRGGYAWLFPRGDTANLGLGVESQARDCLKSSLEQLRLELVRAGRIGDTWFDATGGAIPVGGMLTSYGVIGSRPALLCGDAAGLTNPVTGAGICSAVQSGALAGEAAGAIRNGIAQAAEEYAEELDELFGAAIARAVRRRRDVLAHYQDDARPSQRILRNGWIAYPDYWAA